MKITIELTDEQENELVAQYKKEREGWPNEGDEYWAVGDFGTPYKTGYTPHYDGDKWNKLSGNCFRTEAEAEQYREYLIALNTLKRSSDFVPDWTDTEQKKWLVVYCHDMNRFSCVYVLDFQYITVYYATEEQAEAALSKYRREFEIVYGVSK